MTELEKIAYAKAFIDKLANGVNPIDDSQIPESDVANNVRISRCFFYVSDVLRQVIENGGTSPVPTVIVKEVKKRKEPFSLTPEQKEAFEYSEIPIPATEIINRIIAIGPKEETKKFPKRQLVKWLFYLDLLEVATVNNTEIKRPTESGREIGIILEQREGLYGPYYVVLYDINAQHFIVDNIEALLAFDTKAYKEKMNLDNQGKSWDGEQDERLMDLFVRGLSISEIAKSFKRSEAGIKIRLKKHGVDVDEIPV